MWDLYYLTRDQIHVPCIGSTESEPLDQQESPMIGFFNSVYEFSDISKEVLSLHSFFYCHIAFHQRYMLYFVYPFIGAFRLLLAFDYNE